MACSLNSFRSSLTCLICLEKQLSTTELLFQKDQLISFLNKIYQCFQVTLVYNKDLPSCICKQCIEELNVAWKFREKCLNFSKKLVMLDQNNYNKETVVSDKTNHQDNILQTTPQLNHLVDSEICQSPEHKNNLQCKQCNKSLKNETSSIKHNVVMHQERKHIGKITGFGASRQYNCTKCSYATPHSQTLINHMRRHNGERPYHCDCGKSFTQSSSLAAHRKTHSATTYYTCSVCGKQFKHAFSLKTHLYVHGTGQYSCNLCKKVLKSKQSYQAHMQRHYNIHNYSCEDCGSTFVTSSELLNHRKKHSALKNIECHICGYKTRDKKNLVVHLKRHAGDKSYKCELCAFSFYTKSDLQRHKRVHSHEKPYACPTCGQKFTHSPSLNKHMHNVHGIEYKWADAKWKEASKNKLIAVPEKGDLKR